MKGIKKRHLKKKFSLFLLWYSLFFLFSYSVITMAKYTYHIDNNSVIAVAKPIALINLNNTQKIYPTGTISIPFTITNYNDTSINEVMLRYTLTITKTGAYHFNYQIYEVIDNVNTELDLTTYYQYLPATTMTTKSYLLVIEWTDDEVPIDGLNVTDLLTIDANFKQVLNND